MKRRFDNPDPDADKVIAVFGEAKLVKRSGKLVAVGGSMEDRAEAVKWARMFMKPPPKR